jgi:hypothetical protein
MEPMVRGRDGNQGSPGNPDAPAAGAGLPGRPCGRLASSIPETRSFEAAGATQVAGLFANALRTQGIALAAYLN